MKKLNFVIMLTLISLNTCIAHADSQKIGFMTPRDLMQNSVSSNISLQNNRSSPSTAYGLYVRQYGYVNPGDSCSAATIIYASASNLSAGSVVMPIRINPGKKALIGANYLYNMIYDAIYYVNIIIPSSPPGCALPGCSWGSDTARYEWCIYIGALGPTLTSTGYTANIPPAASGVSGVGYNYNLISDYVTVGPISCSDQTLTCTVNTQQTQPLN